VAAVLSFFGSSTPLLVGGRFVPGARLVVNATLGFACFRTGAS
jgi:hypothetical protein